MRIAKNVLTLTEVPVEAGQPPLWKLQGRVFGKRVRVQSGDLAELVALKAKHEGKVAEDVKLKAEASAVAAQHTRLSRSQLMDAEIAVDRLGSMYGQDGFSLRDAVDYLLRHKRAITPMTCTDALTVWETDMKQRRLKDRARDENISRVQNFLKHAKNPANVHDITAAQIKGWVFEEGQAAGSSLARASRLRTFLNFCVDELKAIHVSPMTVDFRELKASVGKDSLELPGILKPEKCHRLLTCARLYNDGMLTVYTILATWCFMRHAEVIATARSQIREDGNEMTVIVRGIKKGTPATRIVTVPANVRPLLREAIKGWADDKKVPYTLPHWNNVREDAGLIKRGPYSGKHGTTREIIESEWEENILRHSGISYHYRTHQDIAKTTSEAGNSPDTAFKHYVNLATKEEAKRFYVPIQKKIKGEPPADIIPLEKAS